MLCSACLGCKFAFVGMVIWLLPSPLLQGMLGSERFISCSSPSRTVLPLQPCPNLCHRPGPVRSGFKSQDCHFLAV